MRKAMCVIGKQNSIGLGSIAAEWHPCKNGDLKPEDVSPGSHKKVWWQCPEGHEWEAAVKSRTAGRGCPFCSNRKVLEGYNDLATTNPVLAAEWHPEKNGTLKPSDITANSRTNVWWICEHGHEWVAAAYARSDGTGCPYCSGRLPIPGETDLATVNPGLAAEWHPSKNQGKTPGQVTPNSGKKAWWICPKGHEWEAAISSRSEGCGCPYCAGKKAWPGFNDLATVNPALAAEWDYDKNGDLKPDMVLGSSSHRIWWRCDNGHRWEATVNNRSKGHGCPYCAGQRAIPGETDLATVNPALAAEWHPSKNRNLNPSEISAQSGRAAWWLCEKGHEWKATISSRAKGAGCPYCAGRLAVRGETDLATANPALAAEWAYDLNGDITPETVLPNSNKKVWWRCDRGHEWLATPNGRSRGTGCPTCSSENRSSFPEQAVFWCMSRALGEKASNRESIEIGGKNVEVDVYFPARKTGIEYDGAYWHKDKSEADAEKTSQLAAAGIRLIRIKEARANEEEGDVVSYDCYHRRDDNLTWAICRAFKLIAGKEAEPGLIDVARDHSDIEQSYVHARKESSLLATHPQLAREWNAERNGAIGPDMVTAGSSRRVWWRCERGHEWQTAICNRAGAERSGCPYCSGQKTVPGFNDLATLNANLAAEWHPTRNGKLTPQDVTATSGRKVWWQCPEGHEWEATVANRERGRGCPYCGNKRVLPGFNDLASTNPTLASEWHPSRNGELQPTEVTAGTSRKVWWLGSCGHEWEAAVSNRSNGNGCPFCSNRKTLPGFNDLVTTDPALAEQWHPSRNVGLSPEHLGAGSSEKVWWICGNGHEWMATVSSRHKGAGCPYCAGQRAIPGETDLATVNPALAAEWHPSKNGGLKPQDIMAGTNRKVWWLCPACGHEWTSAVYDRSAGNGCPLCHHRPSKALA